MIIADRSNFTIDTPFHGEVGQEVPLLELRRCKDVVIRASFEGVNMLGRGIYATDCERITVEVGHFTNLYRCAVFERCKSVVIVRNEARMIRSDAFDFAECDGIDVTQNDCRDFRPILLPEGKGDHPDGVVQVYAPGKYGPSRNIRVTDNLFVGKLDQPSQGIQIKTENGTRHSNVTVTGNVLINTLQNAILVGHSDEAIIAMNEVAHEPGLAAIGAKVVPTIRAMECAPLIRDNVAPGYVIPGQRWDHCPAGNERRNGDPAKLIAVWEAKHRAPTRAQKLAGLAGRIRALADEVEALS